MKIYRKNSPNHYNGRNGWKADVVVFHQTGGTSATPALNYYMNAAAQCSPNWVIDTDGTIYELVHPDNAAYCNGTRTVPGQKLYYGLATAKLVKERKTNANFFTYSMEFVHCQWGNINDAQIQAAIDLIKNVIVPHMRKNGVVPKFDRDHFIGHCEIDPITRAACPGKQFPYQTIIDAVSGKKPFVPASAQPTTPSTTATFKAGDKVHIRTTASTYAGISTKIPTAYKGDKLTYTITKVAGTKALIKELYSWVLCKDLKKA
jgi:N-acetyl-anhydromuramyl-L-alanine amidase AmpD